MAVTILILVNGFGLVIAFRDNSKQKEKTQTTFFDLFETDDYNFAEYNTGIAILM